MSAILILLCGVLSAVPNNGDLKMSPTGDNCFKDTKSSTVTWTTPKNGWTAISGTVKVTFEDGTIATYIVSPSTGKLDINYSSTGFYKVSADIVYQCDEELTTVSDSWEITLIDIGEIEFLNDDGEYTKEIENDSTVTATADILPLDRMIVWSISSENSFGCTIDANTGVVTSGSESGVITIRAADSILVDCFSEKGLCVGGECCPKLSGQKEFGPVVFLIGEEITSEGTTEDGYCIYKTEASISISMNGAFDKTFDLNEVSIEWEELGGDYRKVKVSWDGEVTKEFGLIEGILSKVSLSVNSAGQVTGEATFEAKLTVDKTFAKIIVLKKGIHGKFTYKYDSQAQFYDGTWDFSGVQQIDVELKKGGDVIATMHADSLNVKGKLENVELKAVGNPTFTTNSFKLTVHELEIKFDFYIADNAIDLKEGKGKFELTGVKGLDKGLILEITYSGGVTVVVDLNGVSAFGCKIDGELTVTMDKQFDFKEVSGSNISGKHQEISQSFESITFSVENGKFKTFNFGSLKAKYQKIEFEIINGKYEEGQLSLDANLNVGDLKVVLNGLKIDFKGNVDVGALEIDVNNDMYTFNLVAKFEDSKFEGKIGVKIKKVETAVTVKVIIGAEETFNYGYFHFTLDTPGIPLLNSGIKLKSLAGEFGYNWDSAAENGSGKGVDGAITIGFGLGLSDVAQIMEINGYLKVNIGAATTITLKGGFKIPASVDPYISGTASITHELGSTDVKGGFVTDIKVPSATGNFLTGHGEMAFVLSGAEKKINANAVEKFNGKILNFFDYEGMFNFVHEFDTGHIGGNASGSLKGKYEDSFEYPDGFDPSTPELGKSTSDRLGFGFIGFIKIDLSSTAEVKLLNGDVTGKIKVSTSGETEMTVRWPALFSSNNIKPIKMSYSGDIEVTKVGNVLNAKGTLKVSSDDETSEIGFDVSLNGV